MKEEDIQKIKDELNSSPISDFDNLSPSDMNILIYNPFAEKSIIQFKKNVSIDNYDSIGFLRLVEFLLEYISKNKEVKLTKWNNLNTKLVTEIYRKDFTGEEVLQLKERKVYKQDDLLSLQNAMIILNKILKFTKVRTGKISLTKKGGQYLNESNRENLLQIIFKAYGLKFNWSYHDGYADESQIQSTFGYILYLLLQYGQEDRSTSFYSQKLLLAFPQLIQEFNSDWSTPAKQLKSCLSIRCFERFLNWFNFITVRKSYKNINGIDDTFIKNDQISNVLELNEDNNKFTKLETLRIVK